MYHELFFQGFSLGFGHVRFIRSVSFRSYALLCGGEHHEQEAQGLCDKAFVRVDAGTPPHLSVMRKMWLRKGSRIKPSMGDFRKDLRPTTKKWQEGNRKDGETGSRQAVKGNRFCEREKRKRLPTTQSLRKGIHAMHCTNLFHQSTIFHFFTIRSSARRGS